MLNEIQDPADSDDEREPTTKFTPGNEADFEQLYQTSYGKILGTLTAMLGDRAAAEDCAQDAFGRAYRKWSSWQPIAPAEAWVHRIAINAAVSHQRKMRRREVGEVIRRIGRPGVGPEPHARIELRAALGARRYERGRSMRTTVWSPVRRRLARWLRTLNRRSETA